MYKYREAHGRLPPAVVYGEDGKALYSWRVLVLPFIEEDRLYHEFHLDEPWDSPDNLKLLYRMPRIFSPFKETKASDPTATFYRVFTGKGTAFEGREGAIVPRDFPDGLSTTILIVEAGEAVPWTKPEEIPYAPGLPLPRLGGISGNGFRAAMADGLVRFLAEPVAERTIRAAITRNGADTLGVDWESAAVVLRKPSG